MGLMPLYDEGDAQFNARAARAAFEAVSKMDFDEAQVLTTMVVADALWDTIEKNQATLQRRVNSIVKKQSLAAAAVAERNGDEELAKRFTELAKARNPYFYGYQFDDSDHPRSRTGQFRTKIRHTSDSPIPRRHAEKLGIPQPVIRDDAARAHYQQEYLQVRDFLNTFQSKGIGGDTDFIYTVQGPDGVHSFREQGTGVPNKDRWNPATERILEVEARPNSITGPGATWGLVSALGGNDEQAFRGSQYARGIGDGATPFYQSWAAAGTTPEGGSNQRLYDRVASGSSYLSAIGNATNNSHLQIAGTFGQIVGNHGPQAEKVIGPSIRRTMYRYRGTEKTPDSALTRTYAQAMRSPENADGSEAGTIAQRTAVQYLLRKVPDGSLYDLNLKSGHTPPSEGVIIDKDGNIAVQAVGYGDDHYLPFNLKNLGKLKGGEYVRTRSVGGPTTEDIYTGLMTGAKQVTVVSRSGIFVVPFDEEFRGTRRYNDKAKRMVDRYGKLVDAIESKQVQRRDIEPSVKRAFAAEVDQMTWLSTKDKRRELQRKINEYKAYPTISAEDEDNIEREVAARLGSDSDPKLADDLRADLRNQVIENKAFNYKLNGDGYAAAIQALHEQFPYYLQKPRYVPRKGEGHFSAEQDQGYVKPRHNRPAGALEGYYDLSIQGGPRTTVKNNVGEPTGKYTADTADYQNWTWNPQNPKKGATLDTLRHKPEATEEAAEGGADAAKKKAAGGGEASTQEAIEDKISREKAKVALADVAWKIKSALNVDKEREDKQGNLKPIINLDEQQFRTWFKNPDNQNKFDEMVNGTIKTNIPNGILGTEKNLLIAYEAAKGRAGGEEFDLAKHGNTVPQTPYEFPGAEYLHSTTGYARKQAALKQISAETPVPGQVPLDQMKEDKDFREALRVVHEIRNTAHAALEYGEPAKYIQSAVAMDPNLAGPTAQRYLNDPKEADRLVENVHRAWNLRHYMPEEPKAKVVNVADAEKADPQPHVPNGNPKPKGVEPIPAQKFPSAKDRAQQAQLLLHRTIDNLKLNADGHKDAEALDVVASDLEVALNADDTQAMEDALHDMYSYFIDHPEVGEVWGDIMEEAKKDAKGKD